MDINYTYCICMCTWIVCMPTYSTYMHSMYLYSIRYECIHIYYM